VPIDADALIPLLGAFPDAVLIATTDGRIIATNATLCALTGYSSEELRDASIEMLIPAGMRARHVALRSAYSAEGGARSMSDRPDIVLLRADGVEVPVNVALCSIPQGDDSVVVATVRDASNQRLADQAAQRERAFLNALNDVSTALLDEGNVDDTLRLLTRRARALLDADLAVLVLPAVDDEDTLVVHVADGLAASELLGSRLPASDAMTELTMRNREPVLIADGSKDSRLSHPPAWPAEMGATLIVPLHARGRTVGCMTIAKHRDRPMFAASDITFMTTFAEKATLAITFAKAQRLAEREAGLRIAAVRSERELALQHALVEQLEEVAKAKSDFVAKISHELRTPLACVIGYVEILIESCQPEADGEWNRILRIVDRNSHRLLLLIESLLTISLIETGGSSYTSERSTWTPSSGGSARQRHLPSHGQSSTSRSTSQRSCSSTRTANNWSAPCSILSTMRSSSPLPEVASRSHSEPATSRSRSPFATRAVEYPSPSNRTCSCDSSDRSGPKSKRSRVPASACTSPTRSSDCTAAPWRWRRLTKAPSSRCTCRSKDPRTSRAVSSTVWRSRPCDDTTSTYAATQQLLMRGDTRREYRS
jgi:PAS domain S-box-containing protein